MSAALERRSVVVFLRRYTRLYAIADLIEAGVHTFNESEVRAWCETRGIKLLDDEDKRA